MKVVYILKCSVFSSVHCLIKLIEHTKLELHRASSSFLYPNHSAAY